MDKTFSGQDFPNVINSYFMQINLVKQKYPPKPLEFSPLKRHERQRRHQVNKKGCLDCFTATVMIHGRREGIIMDQNTDSRQLVCIGRGQV